MKKARKGSSRFSLPVRIIAATLAFVMLFSVLDYLFSRPAEQQYHEEKGKKLAGDELRKDNDYLDASSPAQMLAYIQDLLSGHHSLEEIERGVQIAIAQGRYDDAIALTQKAIQQYPEEDATKGRLYLRLGYLYVMQDDSANALPPLDRGLELAPSPEGYLIRAQVELDLGDMDAALQDVNEYMRTAENPEELLPDLVNIFEAAGQYETAADMYTKLIESTGDAEYYLNRAYCLMNLNRLEEAAADRDLYAAAGGTELGSADVMLGLGWMRLKEYTKAGDSFARAIWENYAEPESLYFYVVLCSYMTRNYERVCSYGDQLITRIRRGESTGAADIGVEKRTGRLNVNLVKMDLASLYQMTGASHMYTGEYDKAVDHLTACLAESPDTAYANYLRGTCLLALERYGEAEADFDTAIAAGQEPERSHYGRAVCRMERGDNEGATEDFEWVVLNGQDEALFEESRLQLQRLMEEADAQEETEISGN